VITELFSLGVTAEVLRAKIDWKSAFSTERSKISATKGRPHQSFFMSQN